MMSQTEQTATQTKNRRHAQYKRIHDSTPVNPRQYRKENQDDGHHHAMYGTGSGQPDSQAIQFRMSVGRWISATKRLQGNARRFRAGLVHGWSFRVHRASIFSAVST